jgi:ABC-type multidrug transport system ATPase subunit
MLITLLIPTSGQARILGRDVVEDPHWVRERIGYVFGGDRGLYERLSALDNLRYFAELYGVEPRRQRERIGELLELVGLAGREKERVEGFSRGMRQRLHIARGLLHDPPVIFRSRTGSRPRGASPTASPCRTWRAARRRGGDRRGVRRPRIPFSSGAPSG